MHWVKVFFYLPFLVLPVISTTNSHADAKSVFLIDYSVSPSHTIESVERIEDPAFKKFSSSILETIREQFGTVLVQSAKLSETWINGLAIVRVPIVSDREEPLIIKKLANRNLDGNCVIESPWLHVSVREFSNQSITGTIYWSERQLMRDKTIMNGLANDGFAPRLPFRRSNFEYWAEMYVEKFINQELQVTNSNLVHLGAPPELLQLFRESPQTTFVQFDSGALTTMRSIAENAAETYAQLVSDILKKCLQGKTHTFRYSSIKDTIDASNE